MRAARLGAAAFLVSIACAAAGCSSGGRDPSAATEPDAGAPDSGLPDAGPPATIAEQRFDTFAPWAAPIDDYLAVGQEVQPGKFNAGIHDLLPFGERMFFGYGDADYNLGENIAIELRHFESPDDPAAKAATIDADGHGAPQTSPYQSGEEQIDRFRLLDGTLWQAGIDSIDADELHTQKNTRPPGIQGNVYRFDGETWHKRRSITGGEHVHDVARWRDATYAVGSGADTRLEFEAGQVFRYLWQSDDLGETFSTVERVQVTEAGAGDTRWVTLLPLESGLCAFGYELDFATSSAVLRNAVYDGDAVSLLTGSDPLGRVFPDDVVMLQDGTALLFGVDVGSSTAHYTALHVANDGTTQPLASLAGATVLDALLTETNEVLYLVTAGDAYAELPAELDIRVLVAPAAKPDATTELLHFTTEVEPVSIAYWKGSLFLGTRAGSVLRAGALP